MARYRTMDDVDFAGKTALVRVDLNVPMADGKVTDATRIDRALPTLRDLKAKGAKIVLLSHFGRPKGKVVPEMSLAPVVSAVSAALGEDVAFAGDCVGETAKAAIDALAPGRVLILENTRFHGGEEKNEADFAFRLASCGDVFVSDAFSAAHRAHASTVGIADHLPAVAGRAMQAELDALSAALGAPRRPVMAIVGGSKVSTKLDLLENLVGKVDRLVIGGGMANTFLHARGVDVGKSLCEKDLAETARRIEVTAKDRGCAILLQTDAMVAGGLDDGANAAEVSVDAVPADKMMLDVGAATVAEIDRALADTKTVLWNGPLGAFEFSPFDNGTNEVARKVASLTAEGALTSVAGGGDTVAALAHAGAADRFTYVSTAGGAFLEWLEGKVLPGVKVLEIA